mgnify:FL=1
MTFIGMRLSWTTSQTSYLTFRGKTKNLMHNTHHSFEKHILCLFPLASIDGCFLCESEIVEENYEIFIPFVLT